MYFLESLLDCPLTGSLSLIKLLMGILAMAIGRFNLLFPAVR